MEPLYPNFNFITNTVPASSKVIELAKMIGQESFRMPYTNQNATPSVKSAYMPREISAVWRERMIFHTWGKKESVVRVAAAVPIQFAKFMVISILDILWKFLSKLFMKWL